MPSYAFVALTDALAEVAELGSAVNSSLLGRRRALTLARAVGRAQVVLLSSHFERYFYAINEEAVAAINDSPVERCSLPESMRLIHSSRIVDELAETSWERRSDKLAGFMLTDGGLWARGSKCNLDHTRLLTWMKAPTPKNLVRYYQYWQMNDIFRIVTRKESAYITLRLGVQQLVDMRNNIAHGDFSAQATTADVWRYIAAARSFCDRADKALSRQLVRLASIARPW